MTVETADAAVTMAFQTPSPTLKIEFQGGEPLLNFGLVQHITERAAARAQSLGRRVTFVIATNLALLDEEVLSFAEDHDIFFSTSLDGPPDLHNRNRPRPGADSWERTIDGVNRIRARLGDHRVSALMTTTQTSLSRPKDIIDCYVEQGFREIFLRSISPYGTAVKLKRRVGYDTRAWIDFYEEGLSYILDLNKAGTQIRETFASIVLSKMLTNENPGYVDLTSPAGIGIGGIVYNYNGEVYASDEGRMLAEMGDTTFRLGVLMRDSYQDMLTAPALLDALEESFALSAPMCCDCAFERYCGSDPVFHHATSGDYVGRKPTSAFCQRNMAIFKIILDKYRDDASARAIFRDWISR